MTTTEVSTATLRFISGTPDNRGRVAVSVFKNEQYAASTFVSTADAETLNAELSVFAREQGVGEKQELVAETLRHYILEGTPASMSI